LALALAVMLAATWAEGQIAPDGGFEARIVAGESASAVLQQWCAAHGLDPLRAQRVAGTENDPGPSVRAALAVGAAETISYRRVKLGCGGQTLSEADNWYLPNRLTPDMNRRLETTQAPFGLVVRPLSFTRRTLAVRRHPDALHVLEVRALLLTGSGAPFSYVVEDYGGPLATPSSR
jgi:chorismate-pyruvate lyase